MRKKLHGVCNELYNFGPPQYWLSRYARDRYLSAMRSAAIRDGADVHDAHARIFPVSRWVSTEYDSEMIDVASNNET